MLVRTDGPLIVLATFRTMDAGGFAASLTVAVVASPAAAVATTSQPDVNAVTVAASQQRVIVSDGRIGSPRWVC